MDHHGLPSKYPSLPTRKDARGRKAKYSIAICERILEAMASGVGLKTASEFCGVEVETVRDWCDRIPALKRAITMMRARAVVEAARALHGYATAPSENSGPAVSACKYFLSTRCPEDWRETHGVDISGSVTSLAEASGVPISLDDPIPGDDPDDGCGMPH